LREEEEDLGHDFQDAGTTLIPDHTSHLMSTNFEEEVGHEFGIVWHEI